MEKVTLKAPLNENDVEEGHYLLQEEVSKSNQTSPRGSFQEIPQRKASASFGCKSVANSIEGNLTENFKNSLIQSPTNMTANLPPIPSVDMEKGNESNESTNEIQATVNLYMMNKLSLGMGFPKQTVKHVLINYSKAINDDINTAIDFCIRAQENGLDEYMTEDEVSSSSNLEDVSFGEENPDPHNLPMPEEIKQVISRSIGTIEELENEEALSDISFSEDSGTKFVKDVPVMTFKMKSPEMEDPESEDSEESEESEEEPDPDEEEIKCLICYDEHPISRTYALSCGHRFGIKCLRMMFKVGINDGKVLDTNCAHFECDQKYTAEDVRSIVKNEKLLEKFDRFRTNIEINRDKTKQWCPAPNCGLWVKGSGWKPKVECANGHRFCFICQQDWHRGGCKDALDNKLLDYVSEKGVSRCPKCNIRTEK